MFITTEGYGFVFYGAPSLTRGRFCLFYMLLALAPQNARRKATMAHNRGSQIAHLREHDIEKNAGQRPELKHITDLGPTYKPLI
jgi:hypothetical protein